VAANPIEKQGLPPKDIAAIVQAEVDFGVEAIKQANQRSDYAQEERGRYRIECNENRWWIECNEYRLYVIV
jgi:hypothetical protein